MKKSELRQVIKEEIKKFLKEDSFGDRWSKKHKLFQTTGNEIRELVSQIAKNLGLDGMFGTPYKWGDDFVDVSIANLGEEESKSEKGKQLIKKVAEALSKKSGGKKITYSVKYKPVSYYEPGRMEGPIHDVDVVVKYKIV